MTETNLNGSFRPIAVIRVVSQLACMRPSSCIILASLAAVSCTSDTSINIDPGSATVGRWTSFYTREFPTGRFEYFYDRSRVRQSGGHVLARWKVVGSAPPTTTLYVIDIACDGRTFTEKGTVIIDAGGTATEVPQSERYVSRPIEAGTSGEVFRRTFCA